MSFTSNIKNEEDTEVTPINDIGICDNCRDERDDLSEIDYLEFSHGPEYRTPIGRNTETVCWECLQEYY